MAVVQVCDGLDGEMKGARDQRSKGSKEQGIKGARDRRSKGSKEQGIKGARDQRENRKSKIILRNQRKSSAKNQWTISNTQLAIGKI